MPMTHLATRAAVEAAFDRQVQALLLRGYPQLAGISTEVFTAHLEPLRGQLDEVATLVQGIDETHIPFVLVVTRDLVDLSQAVTRVERAEKNALTVLTPDDIAGFQPMADLALPPSPVYLLVDIEPGLTTRNVTPDDALRLLQRDGRFPLTLDEGIALVTHYPDIVKKNYGFSLLGSRAGDRRVTAWWMSTGVLKLGWCWAGNPHTWLGSASCQQRLSH